MRTTPRRREDIAIYGSERERNVLLDLDAALAREKRLREIPKYYLNHGSTPELQQMCRAALAADGEDSK